MSENPSEAFQDPLENYDPPEYNDPLAEALVELTVSEMEVTPYASVTPDTTVKAAMERLVGDHIACLMVEDEGRLVGVFGDRDVLDRVALEYDEVHDQPVSEHMTTEPVYVCESDSAAAVLNVMAVSGYRHVPVVSGDGKVVGIVSPNRLTRFMRQHTAST